MVRAVLALLVNVISWEWARFMWARMLSRCWPFVARLGRVARRYSAPKEIALAVALGAALGLLPKVNIFSLVLLVLLVRLKANLLAGLMSTLVFSALGLGCEPFLHRAGFLVLTWQPLMPVWTWIYNLPLAAWTGFNQTLVMGGLCTGAYLVVPVFLFTRWLVEHYRAPLANWLEQQTWVDAVLNSVRDFGRASP